MINSKKFESFFSGLAGQFTSHIRKSIPNYELAEKATINALSRIDFDNDSLLLDIGASEGTFAILLNNICKNRFKTHNLDPNNEMQSIFEKLNNGNSQNVFVKKAFGEGFGEFEGFYPIRAYDIIRESMTFQFISNNRQLQYLTVSNALRDGGVFITQSKCFKMVAAEYLQKEAEKDKYKALSFTPEQMTRKKTSILEGMEQNMVTDEETELHLSNSFLGFYRYWDSCNFHGWIAYNDVKGQQKARNFLDDFNVHYK